MNAPADPAVHFPLGAIGGQIEQALDALRGISALLDEVSEPLPSGFKLAAMLNLIGDRLVEASEGLDQLLTRQVAGSSAGGLRRRPRTRAG